MLYERWRAIAAEHRNDLALRDVPSARAWTFGQLLAWSDHCEAPQTALVFPQGSGPEFILELLRAWRHNRPACPLETDQPIPEVPTPPVNIVHLKRTSATTGAPKFVAFTAAQLAADPANIVATMGLRRDWPNIAAISLAHSYGFSNLVLPLLLHGIPLVLAGSPLPEAVRRAAHELASPFTLAGVPALWRAWHEARVLPRNLKLAISAGAPLPLALEAAVFAGTAIKIHNFMGASECGGIAYDRSNFPRENAALIGEPMQNVALNVADSMLEVRSPAVAETYWPEPQDTLARGAFRSSDLVEIRDGKLFVLGRATDLIQIAGRKVAPEEIERVLLKHPAVRECLVFDAPRREENQIVALLVADQSALAQIQTAAARELAPWQLPRQWRFVDSLGANARGKISRADWRRKFLAGDI